MNTPVRFFAHREDLAHLASGTQLCYLVGSYHGAPNYGDILQLLGNLERLAPLADRLVMVPLVNRDLLASHLAVRGTLGERFASARFLYYERHSAGRNEPRAHQPRSDLVEVAHLPVRPSQILLYGGVFVAGENRGEEQLDVIDRLQTWLAENGALGLTAPEILGVGQHVSDEFLTGPHAQRLQELVRTSWRFGVRDDMSYRVLTGDERSVPENLFFSGDDAVPLLLKGVAEWRSEMRPAIPESRPLRLGIHVNGEFLATDSPYLPTRTVGAVAEHLRQLVHGNLNVIVFHAGHGTATPERTTVTGLEAHLSQLDLSFEIRSTLDIVLDSGGLPLEVDFVVTCSYYVAFTTLLFGIPTMIYPGPSLTTEKMEELQCIFGRDHLAVLGGRDGDIPAIAPFLETGVAEWASDRGASKAAIAHVARLAISNAKTSALMHEFVRDVRVRDVEARYQHVLKAFSDATTRLSDLQIENARLIWQRSDAPPNESTGLPPVTGPVTLLTASGFWSDGWIGPELRLYFRAAKPLCGVTIDGEVPSCGGEPLPLEVSINGTAFSTVIHDFTPSDVDERMGTFSWTFSCEIPPGGESRLALRCRRTWSPSENGSRDDRGLTLLLRKLSFAEDPLAASVEVEGPVRTVSKVEGVWSDGWVGRRLGIRVVLDEPTDVIRIIGHLPHDYGDPVTFVASVAGDPVGVTTESDRSFAWDIPCALLPDLEVDLEVVSDRLWCPADSGSQDNRRLSWVLTRMEFLVTRSALDPAPPKDRTALAAEGIVQDGIDPP